MSIITKVSRFLQTPQHLPSLPRRASSRRYSAGRGINFVEAARRSGRAVLPFLLLALLAAGAFCKLAILDRLALAASERGALDHLRGILAEETERLDAHGDLLERYAHYTLSGMTPEELENASRGDIMDLIGKLALHESEMPEWRLQGNRLSITVHVKSLREAEELAESFRASGMVEYSCISAASAERKESEMISAVLTVLFRNSRAEEAAP